ncbi:MAG: Ig-like domain-containing protein, partial [Candidatus Eiseniibacteriota bacterium]
MAPRLRLHLRLGAAVLLAAGIASCFSPKKITAPATVAAVASVQVSPPSATLTVGGSATLSATPLDADGNVLKGKAIAWSSGNTAAATVDAAGLVSAVAPGSAVITAMSDGMGGTATITVSSVPVASVTVSPVSATLAAGATRQLTASAR